MTNKKMADGGSTSSRGLTNLGLYARDLKRKKEDIERNLTRKIEDYGLEEGTRDFDTAKKQVKTGFGPAADNFRSPDIPKLVSLRAAKEDEISAKNAAPPKRDFSKMQFLDDSMKKGGKVSSASKRADGCCVKGKTKGRYI